MIKKYFNTLLRLIKKPVIAGLLVFIICLCVTVFVTYQRYLIYKNIQQRELTSAANAVKDKIETNLRQAASAASTLSFIVKNYGVGNDFDSIASEILRSHRNVDIIQLVKGGIITHVYPLKGNESAIGFDILADPTVNKGIFQAIERKEIFYGGPFRLAMGGRGIVLDLPIFIDDKFWGFSTVIIKLETLIRSANLENDTNSEYVFQLSRVRPRTNQEEFYLPGADKFKKELSVDIKMTEGKWTIYASFNKSQTFFSPIPFLIIGFLLSLGAGLFMWDKTRQPQKLKRLVDEQSSLLNNAFDLSSIGMALVSLDGKWMKINQELCKMLGYTKEELLSLTFSELTHPDDVEESLTFISDAIKGNADTYRVEKRYYHKDGSIVWAKVNSRIVKDEIGQPLHFVAQIEDITVRKKAEEKVRESELRFREVLENSIAASYKRSLLTNSYDYLSPVFNKIVGYTQEEMNSLPLETVIAMMHPDDIPGVTEGITKALTELNGLANAVEYRFKHKTNNQYRWLRDEFVVMQDEKGQAVALIGSVSDVTEQKNMEIKVKQSEERHRALVQNIGDGIVLLNEKRELVYQSASVDRINGYTIEERLGKHAGMLLHPSDKSAYIEFLNKVYSNPGEPMQCQFRIQHSKGHYIWVEGSMVNMLHNESVKAVIVNYHDITERKKAAEAIKQSEANYRQLFDNSPAPMWVIDERTHSIIQVNQACIKNYGYSEEEFLGLNIKDISPDTEGTQSKTGMNGMFFMGSQWHVKKSGELINVLTSSIPIRLNGEKSILMIAIDVTEKNLYEQKLTKAAIKAQEDERYEIGGELHDNVCQMLAGSLMFLGLMKKNLPGESNNLFDLAYKNITSATTEIRNLSHRLAPAFFDEETLEDAFNRLLKEFNIENRYAIKLLLDKNVKQQSLGRDQQLNLYRILQEQLRNIVKHANATEIKVEVLLKKDVLQMRITDNGIGFDMKAVKGGIGLANMNRRAQLFSGTFRIDSVAGKGCEAIVEIPLAYTD